MSWGLWSDFHHEQMPTAAAVGICEYLPLMLTASEVAHTAVRNSRRLRGAVQLRKVSVTGTAPTAVVEALRMATSGRRTPDERDWIGRIEILRSLLASSPDVLELEDFGAGARSEGQNLSSQALMTTRTLGKMTESSKPPRWAYMLFRLIRELKSKTALELGACVGISAAYQASAMQLNGTGHLITLEGATVLAARATRTLDELGLGQRAEVRLGAFADTLATAIADLAPVDYAFIDGHHVEQATLDYAKQILPALSDEAVLIFDDINWSDGMRRAWQAVLKDDRYALTVDLRAVGLAVVSKSATTRSHLSIGYY